MIVRQRALPLGLDLGTSRVRLAEMRRTQDGAAALAAVAVRDVPEGLIGPYAVAEPGVLTAILEDLHEEIGTKQRGCVLAAPVAARSLRYVRFPPMRPWERRRAAQFEAERFGAWDATAIPSYVSLHRVPEAPDTYAVGIVREDAIRSRSACLRAAKLKVVAVDDPSCALLRAFPFADAVLDIGLIESTLHALSPQGPVTITLPSGGAAVTAAIAADLAVDAALAEKRKRILGTAGAGERARGAFVDDVTAAVEHLRRLVPVRRVALAGNGARLPGLGEAIERATGALADVPVSDALLGGAYPEDVVRAAAPDWTLAASLAGWELAT